MIEDDDEPLFNKGSTSSVKTDLHGFTQGELKKIVMILKRDLNTHFKGYHKLDKEALIKLIYEKYSVNGHKLLSKVPVPIEQVFKIRETREEKEQKKKQPKQKREKKVKKIESVTIPKIHITSDLKEMHEIENNINQILEEKETLSSNIDDLKTKSTTQQQKNILGSINKIVNSVIEKIETIKEINKDMQKEDLKTNVKTPNETTDTNIDNDIIVGEWLEPHIKEIFKENNRGLYDALYKKVKSYIAKSVKFNLSGILKMFGDLLDDIIEINTPEDTYKGLYNLLCSMFSEEDINKYLILDIIVNDDLKNIKNIKKRNDFKEYLNSM